MIELEYHGIVPKIIGNIIVIYVKDDIASLRSILGRLFGGQAPTSLTHLLRRGGRVFTLIALHNPVPYPPLVRLRSSFTLEGQSQLWSALHTIQPPHTSTTGVQRDA